MTSTAGSSFLPLMVMSAPSRLACSSSLSSISAAHTNNPIAFSKRAVFCVAAKFCFSTYRFACGEAVFTMSTRRIQPRHTHAIAFFGRGHAAAERGDNADTFVSGRKRQRGFDRPITIGRVQVGMTYPARLGFHQHLPRPRRGISNFRMTSGLPNVSNMAACIIFHVEPQGSSKYFGRQIKARRGVRRALVFKRAHLARPPERAFYSQIPECPYFPAHGRSRNI